MDETSSDCRFEPLSSLFNRVSEACERFRSRWEAGERPALEQYLHLADEPERRALFSNLLDLELELRRSAGERPSVADYQDRFPDLLDLILLLFGDGSSSTGPEPTPATTAGNLPWADASPADFDQFELIEEIGRGGMGVVYRARQSGLDREVAVKLLLPAVGADPARLKRFINEARIASRLTDSLILPVYDVREIGGNPALIMPLVDGSDLGRLVSGTASEVENGGLPLPRLLAILDQVVDAVATLHDRGVLHRDLKPSNVLVDRRDRVLLSDFGLARLGLDSDLTSPGMSLGTPGYMSPEQWDGSPDLDGRSDVFGLAATLYASLTGKLPFGRQRPSGDGPFPPSPSSIAPRVPEALDPVLLKALDPDRSRRHESARAFREDWRRARAGLPPADPPPAPSPASAPSDGRDGRRRERRRWHRALRTAIVAVGLVVLVVAAFWIVDRLNRPTTVAESPLPAPDPAPAWTIEVRLQTDPPADRAVFVPIDPETGVIRVDRAVWDEPRGGAPARAALTPGEYIVEVAAGDRFHEVRRRVPNRQEFEDRIVRPYRIDWWGKNDDGSIFWQPVVIPGPEVTDGMARFDGSDRFRMGQDGLGTFSTPHEVAVGPFFLDTTEVTLEDVRAVLRFHRLSDRCVPDGLREVDPVCCINLYQAMQYAEIVG
ncbi:bifunctional serine/threonine-protein kinase/formylglycine-generating enzyme family protein [Tautonia sociabilis]|uniref:Serine/threonine protein kinase n=1 Tax=Tautonia sociabilis TaxID=2080755 RepID=A0A432MNP1_9BACT|nr:serine/threonine-protein kinase [Tautonia sociabilis]RUL89054.1 serine/threonine protein kinase [Tautonia sociabilis]